MLPAYTTVLDERSLQIAHNYSLRIAEHGGSMKGPSFAGKAAILLLVSAILGGTIGAWSAVSRETSGPTWLAQSDAAAKCGTYVNSNGQVVPRPCGNWRDGGAAPSGATARCRDGSWSWSQHPNAPGTCSHHGGIESYVR